MIEDAPVVTVLPPSDKKWLYVQSTGNLYRADGSFCAQGYSGTHDGRNNPAMQNVSNVGPLPVGFYRLGEVSNEKGPLTIRLNPDSLNEMHGRSGFLVHGNNKVDDASHGCIIMPNAARQELSHGGVIHVIDRPKVAPESVT